MQLVWKRRLQKLFIESFNDPLMAALIPLGNAGVNCKAAIKWEN